MAGKDMVRKEKDMAGKDTEKRNGGKRYAKRFGMAGAK
jgi:hypothetical protein